MPTKARTTLRDQTRGHHQTIDPTTGAILSQNYSDCTFIDYQRTFSEGHPFKRSANWKKMNIAAHLIADMGGPFSTLKSETAVPGGVPVALSRNTGSAIRRYDGSVFAYRANYLGKLSDTPVPSSNAQLDALGSTAISRVLPTNPLSGIGQFAAELKDLPRPSEIATWAVKSKSFRRLRPQHLLKPFSKEWLNFQFGWLPFVKDLKDFFTVARDADRHIAQYVRDSGRGIRRKYHFPDEITTTVLNMGNGYSAPSLDSYLVVGPGKLTKTETTVKKRWFSGSFTYYLPNTVNAKMREQLAAKLYGLRLTPDLIWKIAPWSWAADWVTNIGDVIHNVSAFREDGLVMRYGYMMETITVTTTYALNGVRLWNQPPLNLSQTFVVTSKTRRKATPYGFGLDPGTFSAKQWSIIAALGITKAPRSLNF